MRTRFSVVVMGKAMTNPVHQPDDQAQRATLSVVVMGTVRMNHVHQAQRGHGHEVSEDGH